MLDDADYVLITYGGASTGNAKEAAIRARERGLRAGVLRIRLFRPFPTDEVVNAIKDARAVAVIDRALSPGNTYEGPVFNDVVSASIVGELISRSFLLFTAYPRGRCSSTTSTIFIKCLMSTREPVSIRGRRYSWG